MLVHQWVMKETNRTFQPRDILSDSCKWLNTLARWSTGSTAELCTKSKNEWFSKHGKGCTPYSSRLPGRLWPSPTVKTDLSYCIKELQRSYCAYARSRHNYAIDDMHLLKNCLSSGGCDLWLTSLGGFCFHQQVSEVGEIADSEHNITEIG